MLWYVQCSGIYIILQVKKSNLSKEACRCNYSATDDDDVIKCTNIKGRRRTRCPCFKSGLECNSDCKCRNCGNGKKQTDTPKPDGGKRLPRKKSYRQLRTSKYMAGTGSSLNQGHWTELETIVLIILSNTLRRTGLPLTDQSYHSFYELLFNHIHNQGLQDKLPIRKKSVKQVSFKLKHLDQRYF